LPEVKIVSSQRAHTSVKVLGIDGQKDAFDAIRREKVQLP
jgi:hypothetical protein